MARVGGWGSWLQLVETTVGVATVAGNTAVAAAGNTVAAAAVAECSQRPSRGPDGRLHGEFGRPYCMQGVDFGGAGRQGGVTLNPSLILICHGILFVTDIGHQAVTST